MNKPVQGGQQHKERCSCRSAVRIKCLSGEGCLLLAQKEEKEWRGGKMGFVTGLLGRYVMFTVAVFVVGGVMGWFFDEKRDAGVRDG